MEDAIREPAMKVSHWVLLQGFSMCSRQRRQRKLLIADLNIAFQNVPTPAERSYTQNLERELKLIASAYHDLASRMQMNNVTLQRRAEAPKSWLGRQRKAMEGFGGLVR